MSEKSLTRLIFALLIAGVLALTAAVPLDLSRHSFAGAKLIEGVYGCGFKRMTCYPCAGCGLTRSFFFMGHGRFKEAFLFNPLGPIFYLGLIGALAGILLSAFGASLKTPAWLNDKRSPVVVALAAIVIILLNWAAKIFLLPKMYW